MRIGGIQLEGIDDMTTQKASNISVSTVSAEPLRGIIEVDCADKVATFEINEDLAHQLCGDLERFLTQVPQRSRLVRAG